MTTINTVRAAIVVVPILAPPRAHGYPQDDAAELQHVVAQHHDAVQKATEPLLAMLDQRISAKKQLDTLAGVEDAIGKSLGAVELCARVLECVERGQYYAALRLVERIRKARRLLPVRLVPTF